MSESTGDTLRRIAGMTTTPGRAEELRRIAYAADDQAKREQAREDNRGEELRAVDNPAPRGLWEDLDDRQRKEIRLALFYVKHCNHGTAGHNRLVLIAQMAGWLGLDAFGDIAA